VARAVAEALRKAEGVVSAFGPISRCARGLGVRGFADLDIFISSVSTGVPIPGHAHEPLTGSSRVVGNTDLARLIAIAEGLERLCAEDAPGEPYRWSSATDLDGASMDLDALARCSTTELAEPRCTVHPFNPHARIRWTSAVELTSRRTVWMPAVLGTFALADLTPGERFTYKISTGYATHATMVDALLAGLLEVVERDAIALTWLQRLPLPLLPGQHHTPVTDYLRAKCAAHFMTPYLFDATTDLAVPIVYCLLVAPHDERVRQVIGCAADRTLARAGERALLEAVSIRAAAHRRDTPQSIDDIASVVDGASYMASAQRAPAFEFLTDAAQRPRPDRPISAPLADDAPNALAQLLSRFADRGMEVLAVDRTSWESELAGLCTANVVVPALQPMSLDPFAQFKAHPRLYDAPRAMGLPAQQEEALNPWPQPFG
jgi:ribosomal protein S12 methylthiotransferase accessory factor